MRLCDAQGKNDGDVAVSDVAAMRAIHSCRTSPKAHMWSDSLRRRVSAQGLSPTTTRSNAGFCCLLPPPPKSQQFAHENIRYRLSIPHDHTALPRIHCRSPRCLGEIPFRATRKVSCVSFACVSQSNLGKSAQRLLFDRAATDYHCHYSSSIHTSINRRTDNHRILRNECASP